MRTVRVTVMTLALLCGVFVIHTICMIADRELSSETRAVINGAILSAVAVVGGWLFTEKGRRWPWEN